MRIVFIRSDAILEVDPYLSTDPVEVVNDETMPFVQLTYDMLRTGPDGDTLAVFEHEADVWYLSGTGASDRGPFSDIVIEASPIGSQREAILNIQQAINIIARVWDSGGGQNDDLQNAQADLEQAVRFLTGAEEPS